MCVLKHMLNVFEGTAHLRPERLNFRLRCLLPNVSFAISCGRLHGDLLVKPNGQPVDLPHPCFDRFTIIDRSRLFEMHRRSHVDQQSLMHFRTLGHTFKKANVKNVWNSDLYYKTLYIQSDSFAEFGLFLFTVEGRIKQVKREYAITAGGGRGGSIRNGKLRFQRKKWKTR